MNNVTQQFNVFEQKLHQAYVKYGLAYEGPPRHLSLEEKNYRIACLFEEIEEFAQSDTLVDQYDALQDLLVFTIGTMYRMGMPMSEGFDAVMQANLAKVPGSNPHKSNKDRAEYKGTDLVKPEGWVGPEDTLTEILINRSVLKKETVYGALNYG
jgi:predicted HAD superfamily Cof-like phosphohydrolase